MRGSWKEPRPWYHVAGLVLLHRGQEVIGEGEDLVAVETPPYLRYQGHETTIKPNSTCGVEAILAYETSYMYCKSYNQRSKAAQTFNVQKIMSEKLWLSRHETLSYYNLELRFCFDLIMTVISFFTLTLRKYINYFLLYRNLQSKDCTFQETVDLVKRYWTLYLKYKV